VVRLISALNEGMLLPRKECEDGKGQVSNLTKTSRGLGLLGYYVVSIGELQSFEKKSLM
jgi:hypothetical protein